MIKFTSQIQFIRVLLFSLLLLSGLFVSGNTYSNNNWYQDHMKVAFEPGQNAFVINMMYYDYQFGPFCEHTYIDYCKFEFSDDGIHYHTLMQAKTAKQKPSEWSWICFSDKYPGAQLFFFYETNIGKQKTYWNYDKNLRLETSHPNKGHEAWITFNWLMNEDINNIKTIRVSGVWTPVGPLPVKSFNYIAYEATKPRNPKTKFISTKVMKPTAAGTIVANVTKQADAIVVSGAKAGENIEVRAITGQTVQTTVAVSDVVKSKFPQIKFILFE